MPSATAPTPSPNSCRPASSSAGAGFAVYVHWPFCLSKCPYCDFNSHVREAIDEDAWTAALVRELVSAALLIDKPDGGVSSIFFGGGTPSLMPPATVAAVIDTVADRLGLAAAAEITLEANPTSVEAARFTGYAAAGINRFSLGVQALDDEDLAALGRAHSVSEAQAALAVARAEADNVSIDLIYARPGQTPAQWRQELTRALEFGLPHLSLYQLTIERGTRFHEAQRRGDLVVPDEDTGAALFELTQELCETAGLPAYEISNHARSGAESRHNLSYWRSDPYLGIGPGAHGRVDTAAGRTATSRLRSPEKWLDAVNAHGQGTESAEGLSRADLSAEILMMGLRLREGVSARRFEALTGVTLTQAISSDTVSDLTDGGYLISDDDGLRTTDKGAAVLNTLIGRLLA